MRTAGLVFSLLGILFGGCKDSEARRADGAVDAPQAGTTSTRTSAAGGSSSFASAGQAGTTTSTRTSAAGGLSSAASAGQGGSAGTGGIRSSGGSGTSTSAPTRLDAGTNPDLKVWNKTWTTIKVERLGAAGFRPPRNTAASVTIKRGQDGSLVLSGETFRVVSGDYTNCYINDGSACLVSQAFPETTLTPAQAAELDRQVAAMPPGQCTHNPKADPSVVVRFGIDETFDVDNGAGMSMACLEDSGPGTHLAAERAIIAYIDSLIPAEADAGAITDAMISKWIEVRLDRLRGRGFCPTADTAYWAAIKRSYDGSSTLRMQVFRLIPGGKPSECFDLTPYTSKDCFQSSPIYEIKLTPAESDQIESLVAALPRGQCTSDGSAEPCLTTTVRIGGFSTTDLGEKCRETAGPGTHLAILRKIVAFIDSFVPPAAPTAADASVRDTR